MNHSSKLRRLKDQFCAVSPAARLNSTTAQPPHLVTYSTSMIRLFITELSSCLREILGALLNSAMRGHDNKGYRAPPNAAAVRVRSHRCEFEPNGFHSSRLSIGPIRNFPEHFKCGFHDTYETAGFTLRR